MLPRSKKTKTALKRRVSQGVVSSPMPRPGLTGTNITNLVLVPLRQIGTVIIFGPALSLSRPQAAFRKVLALSTSMAALFAPLVPASAAPTGGNVVAGSAGIQYGTTVTNINQSSNRAIINWQSFSIGAGETVNFNQPGFSSVTLNRVTGNETSIIAGALNANGQVFIVNSAGVLFSKGSQVNVGGLVASTLNISNKDFMAGNYKFHGKSDASIINEGLIHAGNGGYVALLGQTVSNQGVISATLGTVAMASGEKITLNFSGNSLIDVTIDKGTLNALVENKQLIKADGGHVIMTARAADSLLSAQVNNSGIIQAHSMSALMGGGNGGHHYGHVHVGPVEVAGHQSRAATRVASRPRSTGTGGTSHAGSIELLAIGGTVTVSGTLDASAPKGGDGGTIETSGNKVSIIDGTVITTKSSTGQNGLWTIDPDGFTIGAGGDLTGTQLSAALAIGDVTIQSVNGNGTDGNINVNDAVNWSANTLTLEATNNIYINNVMTATGTASLNATYGSTGINLGGQVKGFYIATGSSGYTGGVDISGTGGVTLNGTSYHIIDTAAQLAKAEASPSGNYALGANIGNLGYADLAAFGFGSSNTFTGSFTGLGHALSTATAPDVSISNAVSIPANVTLTNFNLTSNSNLNVNAPVSWSSNLLTLNAADNVYVNAVMTATNNASFAATYGTGLNADGYKPYGL